MVQKTKFRGISLAVWLAFAPALSIAAGLGKLSVNSGLGEPLSAEIEVISATPEELSGMAASIASEQMYAQQGLDRPGFHNAIRTEIQKKPDGSTVIRLFTGEPVNDPFVDMLIQVDWASGRLVREFTVLLDPPGYTQSGVSSAKLSESMAEKADAPAPASALPIRKSTTRKQPKAEAMASPATSAPATSGGDTLTTQNGDSLSKIAMRHKTSGASLEQLLAGIYRENASAFINGNMNRLKVGQVIRIPDAEAIQSISQADAVAEIRAHSRDWEGYQSKLAAEVTAAPSAREEASPQVAKGKLAVAGQEKVPAPADAGKDVVKLSKGDVPTDKGVGKGMPSGKANDVELKSANEKIAALQEETTASEKSLKEARERSALLEKQIQDMQKLLEMKEQAAKNVASAPTAESQAPEKPVSEVPVKVADNQNAANSAPPQPVAAKPAEEQKPKPVVPVAVPPVAPAAEPGFLDGLGLESGLLPVAGLILAGLLGGWVYMRNKRKKGLDSFEKSILTAGGLKANTVFGNTLGGSVDTGDTSFLTDFSQNSGGGMIDTNDVDPIAEAEVYMAYGRDRQAEEILKDAISKEPKRFELHAKLLELYHARKDISAFEALSGELYTGVGTSHPIWQKVVEMGSALEPDNPLYQSSESVEEDYTATVSRLSVDDFSQVEEVEKPTLDFSVDTNEDAPLDVDLDGLSEGNAEQEDETPLDFDLGLGAAIGDSEGADGISEQAMSTQILTPESSGDDDTLGMDATQIMDLSQMQDDSNTLDFNFDLGITAPSAETAASGEASEITQTDQVDLDLSELGDASALDDVVVLGSEEVLPELAVTAVPEEDAGVDMALDLPELTVAAVGQEVESAVPEATIDDNTSDVAMDFNTSDLPETEAGNAELAGEGISSDLAPTADSADTPVDDVLDIGMESAGSAEIELTSAENETIVLESPESLAEFTEAELPQTDLMGTDLAEANPADSDLELDFDLDVGDSANAEAVGMDAELTPQPLDLSGISLDLTDSDAPALDKEADVHTNPTDAEPAEVDTKLDLVAAYMDMGDVEGAKELLEEILQEGGPVQKQKAIEIQTRLG